MDDRRHSPRPSTAELHKLSRRDVRAFIEKERRRDERQRLEVVQNQFRLWRTTVTVCVAVNLVLVGLGLLGWLNG